MQLKNPSIISLSHMSCHPMRREKYAFLRPWLVRECSLTNWRDKDGPFQKEEPTNKQKYKLFSGVFAVKEQRRERAREVKQGTRHDAVPSARPVAHAPCLRRSPFIVSNVRQQTQFVILLAL